MIVIFLKNLKKRWEDSVTLFLGFLKENHLLIIGWSFVLLIILIFKIDNLISENEIIILQNQELLQQDQMLKEKLNLLEKQVYTLENPDNPGLFRGIWNFLCGNGKNLTTYFKKW
jgi:hypothetical protein